jgi:hypothetical protein
MAILTIEIAAGVMTAHRIITELSISPTLPSVSLQIVVLRFSVGKSVISFEDFLGSLGFDPGYIGLRRGRS